MSKEHTIEPVQDIISIPGNEIKQDIINHLRSEVLQEIENELNQD